MLVTKNFGSKNVSQEKFGVKKKYRVQKILGPKKVLVKNILCPKYFAKFFAGQKEMLVFTNILRPRKVWIQNEIIYSQKKLGL